MTRTGMSRHAAGALAHPVALVAALALGANALWWQRAFPSWWTGKIGDVAWLAVAPLGMGLMLAVAKDCVGMWGVGRGRAGGDRKGQDTGRIGAWAIVLTGAAFVLVKTVPAANALVVGAFAAAGVNAKLALDPTDLLALPGLGLAWAAWSAARSGVGVARRVLALGLAAGAVLADSAGPGPREVVCVGQGGFTLYAVQEWSAGGYFNSKQNQVVFTSEDGGATWVEFQSGAVDLDESRGLRHWCDEARWPLADPQEPARQFYYVAGAGLYVSTDGGQTLTLDRAGDLPASEWAAFDQATGNLVLAAGREGVWVRSPEGSWTTVAIGP